MSQINYNFNIIRHLLKTDNHIRGLAKSLGTNQTTVARKVQELEHDNIIDSRFEGKNKVVFLKKSLEARQAVFCVEALKLSETLDKYPFLRRIFELIINNKKISLAVLFGSYSKGLAKKESDIDIYLDTIDNKLKETINLIDSRISVKIGKYNKDSLLIKEIEKNHIIIKGIEQFYEKNKFFN